MACVCPGWVHEKSGGCLCRFREDQGIKVLITGFKTMSKKISMLLLQLALIMGGQSLFVGAAYAQDGVAPADAPAAWAPAEIGADNTASLDISSATSAADQAEAETAAAHNPYGLQAAWESGDIVAKVTFFIMIIMSAGTWYLLVVKLWEQTTIFRHAKQAAKLWEASSLEDGIKSLKESSPFRAIAEDGLNAFQHHDGRLTDKIGLQDWVTLSVQRSSDEVTNDLQGGLAFLATVGSTAPFIGLFGTVWGIYHALVAIGVAGQASIDKVAGPVGEALIMTAIGLAVAVPAVLAYNWLTRRNKVATEQVRAFAADVHAYLLMGVRGQ